MLGDMLCDGSIFLDCKQDFILLVLTRNVDRIGGKKCFCERNLNVAKEIYRLTSSSENISPNLFKRKLSKVCLDYMENI